MTDFHLEARYLAAADPASSAFELTLYNLGSEPVRDFRLAYAALTRLTDDAAVEGARFLRRIANFHEFQVEAELPAGGKLSISVKGLLRFPLHRVDGPKSAYLTLSDGRVAQVSVGDLALVGGSDSGELREIPEGRHDLPLSITPWPNSVEIDAFTTAVPYAPAEDASPEDRMAVATVARLAHRLFPQGQAAFRLDGEAARAIRFVRQEMPKSGYGLAFDDGAVTLTFGDEAGRAYGLTVLAQLHRAATHQPDRFRLPLSGRIEDAPRYGWRGGHLDVSRHFWTVGQVKRFIDILAWGRMNVMQWHLTDDEAWRLEIKALPKLTEAGARRGPGCEMVGQLGFIGERYEGHYTQDQVRDILAHARALHVDVMPEIDIPGHSTAALAAYPHLRDRDEAPDSYRSVQGYPNNALNPAIPQVYEFLETVFTEVAMLFDSPFIHVGADEVDKRSWLQSPRAQAMMKERNIEAGTMGLQAHLLLRVQDMLRRKGKRLAGWDEVSYGGGIDAEGALLVAWQKPEVIRELVEQGYDVIASPGSAYYMDMVQATGWNEPGASWAGVSTPEHCYTYEAVEGLTKAQAAKVKGVQACIWGEHLTSVAFFNHMVFPRLYAVAEAGWTQPEHKDWLRFAALSRQLPQL
jgi:hexosaminidase